MEQHEDKIVTLPNGRDVSYATYGEDDPLAPTVVYLHGFPGAHYEGYLVHEAATQQGVRVIAVSRSGSCKSTFYNWSIKDYPTDVLAVADALSVKRFAILGVSGGGPYAVSCLRSLPRDRLVGVGLVAPLMPKSLGLAGMLVRTRIMFGVAPWATGLLGWIMDREIGTVSRDAEHPEKLERLMDKDFQNLQPLDRDMYNSHPILRDVLVRSSRGAFEQGGYAAAWEARLFGSHWGFELGDVNVEKGRVILWHGDQDHNVPYAMAVKAVQLMPGMELRTLKGDSHMTLIGKTGDFVKAMKDILLG